MIEIDQEPKVCHCCKRTDTKLHWKQFPEYVAANCIDTVACQKKSFLMREQVIKYYGPLPDEDKVEVFVLYHVGVVYRSPAIDSKRHARPKKFFYGPL